MKPKLIMWRTSPISVEYWRVCVIFKTPIRAKLCTEKKCIEDNCQSSRTVSRRSCCLLWASNIHRKFWFCSSPLIWGSVSLYMRSPKGGCCSISDDLSCLLSYYVPTHISEIGQRNRNDFGQLWLIFAPK